MFQTLAGPFVCLREMPLQRKDRHKWAIVCKTALTNRSQRSNKRIQINLNMS